MGEFLFISKNINILHTVQSKELLVHHVFPINFSPSSHCISWVKCLISRWSFVLFYLQDLHDGVDIYRPCIHRRRISGCLCVHTRGTYTDTHTYTHTHTHSALPVYTPDVHTLNLYPLFKALPIRNIWFKERQELK